VSLWLHHDVHTLHRVPDGIGKAQPDRVDVGWRPEGARAVPPATAQVRGAVGNRRKIIIIPRCREHHSVMRMPHH